MNDPELQSLLEDAGYRYDPVSGQFTADSPDDAPLMSAEDVSDELGIPLDDLIRWQQESGQIDGLAAD